MLRLFESMEFDQFGLVVRFSDGSIYKIFDSMIELNEYIRYYIGNLMRMLFENQ